MLVLRPKNGSASKCILHTKKCARENFIESHDHKIIQAERDLRGSLVQLFSQTSSEIRPGCRGFIESALENLQAQRLHIISGQPAPLLDCPPGGKIFSLNQCQPLLFQLMPFASIFPPCIAVKSLAPSSQ